MFSLPLSLLLVSASMTQGIDATDTSLEEPELIEVSGRAIKSIGAHFSSSSGTVGYDDLKARPISRAGEILEVVPGLIATQHSGSGKSNQLFLRGFNLDHGTDFATFVDGVPLNMRSHGHGQGYTDLNILIPELIERVDFQKGPNHAEVGDFSSAGNARISTYDQLENNLARITYGSFGYGRAVVASSFDLSENIHVLAALEGEKFDGPFEVEEDFEKLNAFVKLSGQTSGTDWKVSFSGYDADWFATDQIPLRLVESGELDLFGSIDPDLGGNTKRYSAAAEIATENANFSAYFVDYNFQLFSNFTYFLSDPISIIPTLPGKPLNNGAVSAHRQPRTGDEFEQYDNRQIFGSKLEYSLPLSDQVTMLVGAEFRHDNIDEVGLYGTQSRVRHTLIRQDAIKSTSYSGYAVVRTSWDNLRLEAGLRTDTLNVTVDATRPQNSGSTSDAIFSPTVSVAYLLNDQVEVYANYGESFHSNDARGATISIDPATGRPVEAVPLLVKSRGAELGLRYEHGNTKLAFTGFWLNLASELVYVGDAGTVEAQGGSRRYGFEASAFWQMNSWANAFANFAVTNARFRSELDDRIPNAVPTVFSAGLKLQPLKGFTSNLILRHFGSAPLVEDESVSSNSTTTLNYGGFYDVGRFRFGLEILNLLNNDAPDISYFFESQLANERSPVADVHAHPLVPRQFRLSAAVAF